MLAILSIQAIVYHIASEDFLREKMEKVEISEPDDQLRANMLFGFNNLYLFLVYTCLSVYVCVNYTVQMCGSEDNSVELVPLFHHMGFWGPNSDFKSWQQHPDPLSYHIRPHKCYLLRAPIGNPRT